jgi:arylsulfatase A-like enzyme/Flp pilus assembly protein TadD
MSASPSRLLRVVAPVLLLLAASAGCSPRGDEAGGRGDPGGVAVERADAQPGAAPRAPTARPAERARRRPAPGAPSVLLVTIDTLRADHVGAYGAQGVETPTLDRLAAEGVRFERAFAVAPLTLPSHASILTGLLPPRHGVRHNGLYRLPESVDTVAVRMRDAGYATGAFLGAIVLAKRHGLGRGFDVYDEDMSGRRASATGYPERPAAEVSDRAITWLAQTPGPFFLWVHFYDPHAAYQPPAPWNERFRKRPYDGEVASVDAALGRLVGALADAGRLDGTLVVATADHGESLGEHGERTHGYTLYDASLAVPLVLRGPGVPRGAVVPDVVSGVDVAPTVLALAGEAPLAGADGRDLSPLFRAVAGASPLAPRPAYAESLATRLDHGWSPLFALRDAAHHYVRAPRPELYAASSDPGQTANLFEREPARAQEIARGSEATLAALLADDREGARIALDETTRAQLEALGYAIPASEVPETGIDPKDGMRFVTDFVEAKSAYYGGDPARAAALAEPLVAHMPASVELHELLARIRLGEGRADLAKPHADTAVRLAPGSAPARALLADVATELGDEAGALEAFRVASSLDPTLAIAQVGLVWSAGRAGRTAEADAFAREAARLAPDDADVRERLGAVWDRLGEPERARAAYEEALRLDPGARWIHMALAIQYARAGLDARSERERALAGEHAETPALVNRLAIVYAARGDAERAESLFRDLLERHPGYASARRNLALLLRKSGRAHEADVLEAPPAAPAP